MQQFTKNLNTIGKILLPNSAILMSHRSTKNWVEVFVRLRASRKNLSSSWEAEGSDMKKFRVLISNEVWI